MRKVYLGDGVYAVWDPKRGIILTTEDGIQVTNTIVLEPDVYNALVQFVQQLEQ